VNVNVNVSVNPARIVGHPTPKWKECLMNPHENALDYPFGDKLPATSELLEVAPGVFWLRMALPFALNHINLWLLADESPTGQPGWCIIDCGIANDETRSAWQAVFAQYCQNHPVLRVLATHCHPDHIGNAAWLCEHWQVALWASTGEYAFARMMSAGLPGVDGVAALPHFERHGLTAPALLEAMRSRRNYYTTLVPAVPQAYTRLSDQQALRIGAHTWRVITGFGHSPEHIALYCENLGVLISGDMVLPRISTNVSVFAVEPDGNPLRLYLDSLHKFNNLPETTLVLPSHGKPFHGLSTRIAQLRVHHEQRLNEVRVACGQAKSAAEIVPIMFPRELDPHQYSFAMGEAIAHLQLLYIEGELCRDLDSDGVIRYRTMLHLI
jgi:glyoxylase-like metal-dependent hydrolase (beta-lactamase superfamily II)